MPAQSTLEAYWWAGAAKARAAADTITDPEAKREMLAIAEVYAQLALRAERTAGKGRISSLG